MPARFVMGDGADGLRVVVVPGRREATNYDAQLRI
jgi:hypothetical protein